MTHAMPAPGSATPVSWMSDIRPTLALAWPMVLTNLAQVAMTMTDVMLLGRLSPTALASGSLGHNLYFMLTMFGLGLIQAVSPMMARAIGAKHRYVRDVRRTVRQGLWVSIAAVVPIWIILAFAEDILLVMTGDAALSAGAAEYTNTLAWAALPFYGYIVLRSFISALERPRWALLIAFITVGFNALFAWVLIFGHFGFPALGLAGAGLATAMASTMMFVGMVLVVTLDRQFRRFHLFGNFWRPDWPRVATLLKIGLPIAGILCFEVSIFNVTTMLMGRFGAETVAAHAIALQICSACFMIPMGMGQAVTVRVGIAYGAGDPERIARAGWTAFAIGVSFMVFTAIMMLTIPRVLISGFIDVSLPENQELVRLAIVFLAFAALFQITDGAQAVASGMLRGLHDTTVPMLYALLGYWGIGMTSGYVLAFHYGMRGAGLWTGLCLGLTVVAVLLLYRWITQLRRLYPALRAKYA